MSNTPELGKEKSNKPIKPRRTNGRGSIYKVTTKSGRVIIKAVIHDINGKRRPKTFTKMEAAEDWLADQRRARDLGENTYATNPKMTVEEFLLAWVNTAYGDDQASTRRGYKSIIVNHINPAIGKMKASTLTARTIEGFFRGMADKGSGAGTINLARAALSAAYNDAVRLGDMVKNPVRNAKKPNVTIKTTKPIPREDWEKIYIEASKYPFMHARIELAGMLGLRPGEVLGLKWEDLDTEQNTLTISRQIQRVTGKGLVAKEVKQKKVRTLIVPDTTVQILLKHKKFQAVRHGRFIGKHEYIFTNSRGNPFDEKTDRASFKGLLTSIGLPDYQLYQLRKTAFTALAAHTDLRTLMEFTGHSQVSTVLGSYVFATTESMTKAVNNLDKLRPVVND
jgi:integrase